MNRMTGPDCAVMFNLIHAHTHTHTHKCQQVARSFGRKTRCLSDDVVPRGEQANRDEREGNCYSDGNRDEGGDVREDEGEDDHGNEHEGGNGGENGSGNGSGNGINNIYGLYDGGGGEGERGRRNLPSGNRRGPEDARRGATPMGNRKHSRKTACPSETVVRCGGPEPRDGRRETGSWRAEQRRRSTRNPRRVSCRRDVETGGDLGGKRRKRRQDNTGSVHVDPEDLEN